MDNAIIRICGSIMGKQSDQPCKEPGGRSDQLQARQRGFDIIVEILKSIDMSFFPVIESTHESHKTPIEYEIHCFHLDLLDPRRTSAPKPPARRPGMPAITVPAAVANAIIP